MCHQVDSLCLQHPHHHHRQVPHHLSAQPLPAVPQLSVATLPLQESLPAFPQLIAPLAVPLAAQPVLPVPPRRHPEHTVNRQPVLQLPPRHPPGHTVNRHPLQSASHLLLPCRHGAGLLAPALLPNVGGCQWVAYHDRHLTSGSTRVNERTLEMILSGRNTVDGPAHQISHLT